MEPEVRTLRETAAARVLRAELMAMASHVARDPSRTATLRLVRPRISEERLEEEWRAAASALRPAVLSRPPQVVFPDGRSRLLGASPGVPPAVGDARDSAALNGTRLPSRDLSFAVEKVLVWAWFTRRGPLTRKWLERTAGCSYPTVASVVSGLDALCVGTRTVGSS
jgi:hypothetical protein